MPLALREQLKREADALLYLVRSQRGREEILDRVEVHLADGRIAHPASRTWAPSGHPEPLVVSPQKHFAQYRRTSDGEPGRPEPYQIDFLRLGTPYALFAGGVGAGKTAVGGCAYKEIVFLNPKGLSIIGAPSSKTLWANLLGPNGKFESLIEPWMVIQPARRHEKGLYGVLNQWGYYEIRWINGHTTYALTLEAKSRADLRIQGPDACGLWGDEFGVVPEVVFQTFRERLRDESGMMKKFIITTSLDRKSPWMKRLFFDVNRDTTIFGYVKARTRDATFRSGTYVREQEAGRSAASIAEKLDAEDVVYEGLVYGERQVYADGKAKREPAYLSSAEDHPCWMEYAHQPGQPVFVGFDPGDRRAACVFAQEIDRLGVRGLVIFKEIILSDTSTEQIGFLLQQILKGEGGQEKLDIFKVYTDYSTKALADRNTLKKFLQGTIVAAAVGLGQEKFWDVPSGVELVKRQCCDFQGTRRLWIARSLYKNDFGYDMCGLRQCFQNYHYHEWIDGKPISDEPVKDGKEHAMDALRYLVLGRCIPRGSVSEAKR